MRKFRLTMAALLVSLLPLSANSAVADKDIHGATAGGSVTAADGIDATLPSGYWRLQNQYSGLCMTLGSATLGAPFYQDYCNINYTGQVYDFPMVGTLPKVRSWYANNCVGAKGLNATLHPCYWSAVPVHALYSNGGYRFMSHYDTSLCLALNISGGSWQYQQLQWVGCGDTANQRWTPFQY